MQGARRCSEVKREWECDPIHGILTAMFERITRAVTAWTGSPAAVIGAILVVAVWALTGPIFGFSDTWQLVINTGTTILTFNMVFVIQAAQNRDGVAVQAKLDEILEAISGADNRMIKLEEDSEEKVEQVQERHREVKKES
jgi:low affinity Fe/Cu permease